MNDSLGDRMKQQYENRTRMFLPRRTHTLIRLDGCHFHSYTRGCNKPYDVNLMMAMNATAVYLCNAIQGCKVAYVQSDEITILLTDFDNISTNAWFDGNIQKITSVSASLATACFNAERLKQGYEALATFDSRVWTIADRAEVLNAFVWRQQDATRNSIQMAAQSLYSHNELNEKNTSELQEMMHKKSVNWNDYPVGFKRGRVIKKRYFNHGDTERSEWFVDEPPVFTQDWDYLGNLIPSL